MQPIRANFRGERQPQLHPLEIGTGRIERSSAEKIGGEQIGSEQIEGEGLRFVIGPAAAGSYSDAQIFDYKGLARRDFPDRPPLRMTVRAWASHNSDQLVGTAGFGFWNQPVMPGEIGFRLPRAVWFFFGSPPSAMNLAKGVPGYGWKAATLDATRLPFLLLLPTAPLGFLLMRSKRLYNALWPIAQRALGVSEKSLDVKLTEPHTYQLDWLPQSAQFFIDGTLIHKTPYAPHGPLGFVAWLDNQYAIVTPQGHFRMGLLPVPQRQWLALDSLTVEPL